MIRAHSQESQLDRREQVSLERPDAKTVGRDLALKHIADSRANQVFKERTLRNFRQKFDVPEDGRGEFHVNGAMWAYL